ncbi:MAG: Uma2 family endonuclease [Blastochloris sp.]|nr:Uma2 family endonuclease [Blastochloris sp.]
MMQSAPHRQRLTVEQWHMLPESKLELIGGKLIAGNSLAGSQVLLWAILHACGPRAALPFASPEHWRAALAAAFPSAPTDGWPAAWERWANQCADPPPLPSAGPHFTWRHHRAYSVLMLALYRALREEQPSPLGRSIQRFCLRLGDNGFVPDLQVFRRDRLHHLKEDYFDGPADLVIEVILPGHEQQDRAVKARRYAEGGVPEYWVIDPAAARFEVFVLVGDRFVAQAPDADACVRSRALPGLTCRPARLWACLDDPHERYDLEDGMVWVEPTDTVIGPETTADTREPWRWEWRPYTPPVGLAPTPISFAQFIEWCPEAKFELLDGVPHIGGWDGTRKVLGLLLMTFGLEAAVQLLHPQEWVAALLAEEIAVQRDAARREQWWQRAHEAAALLRERFGVRQVVVLGDLMRPEPLHFWSELTLVVSGLPRSSYEVYTALQALGDAPEIDLRRVEDLAPRQAALLHLEGRDV